jgi:CubicO group peptidase (beta-lactamase class C family)/D-alanyl-D-alanine dipeptidase
MPFSRSFLYRSFLYAFCAILPAVLLNPVAAQTPSYAEAAKILQQFIDHEQKNHSLPAVSIALIDDQQVVWSQGFGLANPDAKTPASADTIYRVGSVSKLFTDTAVMQLVEQGKIDLDAPVTRYLPDFHPRNPYNKPITLRELMSHRSGLVREPPVGHYFDSTNVSLQATVESVNQTALVYPPGTHTKYSNAAIAVVGYVLQRLSGTPFTDYVRDAVLQPLGMSNSAFTPTPEVTSKLARSYIWTYDGRLFDAPTFQLGMAPAGCMYSSVLDLSKFVSMLFAEGQGSTGRLLKSETLHSMWQPQFSDGKAPSSFGVGFALGNLDGHPLVGHGGAIYGFATELEALPQDKLGVVVVTTMDSANAVVTHIAQEALRLMLAAKSGKPLPAIEETQAVPVQLARSAAAAYRLDDKKVNLLEEYGKLYSEASEGGYKLALRTANDQLVVDDRLSYGKKLELYPAAVKSNETMLRRQPDTEPPAASKQLDGLIGEYGWDYDTLYILERNGKLTSLIEWYEFEPLEQISANIFRYPRRGLYDNETLTFTRDANGRATQVQVGGVVFKRRSVGPADGKIFRITPVKPVAELRKEALALQPPVEHGDFRQPDLVELTSLDSSIKLDIRYASTDNFLSSPMYQQARAFMQRPAAEALVRASKELHREGFGLLIHDAYRPWYVTRMFWDGTPPEGHIFVADPSQGSRHNRGCAVDLTMYELSTGKPVKMVGVYDEQSPRSYPFYPGGTSRERWLRTVLRHAMEEQGFAVYETEWWHFDYSEWHHYPILNLTFEQLLAGKR